LRAERRLSAGSEPAGADAKAMTENRTTLPSVS
jgi:hypothetical protein